jgi:hypothetical protein
MNMHMPAQEGSYLFYFGNAANPFYAVDTLRFTVVEDEYKTQNYYLEDHNELDVTMWWFLPIPHAQVMET